MDGSRTLFSYILNLCLCNTRLNDTHNMIKYVFFKVSKWKMSIITVYRLFKKIVWAIDLPMKDLTKLKSGLMECLSLYTND